MQNPQDTTHLPWLEAGLPVETPDHDTFTTEKVPALPRLVPILDVDVDDVVMDDLSEGNWYEP